MRIRWVAPFLLAAALPLTLLVTGCSDDDGPNDPHAGLHQVYIRLGAGDMFSYDRWDLDANNQKIEATKRAYDIEFSRGIGLVGPYSDWFFRIGRDRVSNKRDTLFIRMENRTRPGLGTSYTQEVMAYGFAYKMLQSFIAEVMKIGNVGVPQIPAPQWDVIAKYYDAAGNPLDVGTEWVIGQEHGTTMNFTIEGSPVPVVARIKGRYEAREEKVTANNKEIKTWKSSVLATFTLLGSVNLDIKLNFWFSDDPATQVRVLQESAKATIPIVNIEFDIPGETQELVSWF